MNVRHLAELAGLMSVHALQIIESTTSISQACLNRLGELSEKRMDTWAYRLNSLETGSAAWASLYPPESDARTPLIEEILVSELLTRVVAGVLAGTGRTLGDKSVCLTASVLFNQHQESRRMVLKAMVEMAEAENPAVRKLDRLRRSSERWADVLLGPLVCRFPLKHLVFDAVRSLEHGQAMLPHLISPAGYGLVAGGLRVAIPETVKGVPSHAGLHRDMAAAVIALLPEELWEQDGSLLPLRTVRAMRVLPLAETSPKTRTRGEGTLGELSANPNPQNKLSLRQMRRRWQKP